MSPPHIRVMPENQSPTLRVTIEIRDFEATNRVLATARVQQVLRDVAGQLDGVGLALPNDKGRTRVTGGRTVAATWRSTLTQVEG